MTKIKRFISEISSHYRYCLLSPLGWLFIEFTILSYSVITNGDRNSAFEYVRNIAAFNTLNHYFYVLFNGEIWNTVLLPISYHSQLNSTTEVRKNPFSYFNPPSYITGSKEFTHQYTLMRHLPTHTDERKFQCNTCGKGMFFWWQKLTTAHIYLWTLFVA